MISASAVSVSAAAALGGGIGGLTISDPDLARGAIAGSFIAAAAFLAGYAAIRRSGLAVCALLMVLGAGALQFSWLGFMPAASPQTMVLIQALFAAAAIVFLSGAIGAARHNHILGGLMFVAALVIGGMGLINFFDRVELAGLMRWSLIGVAAFAATLTVLQAFRGDSGARLILPGVAMAAAAPLVGPFGIGEAGDMNVASHGLFTLGVLIASIVALTESAAPRLAAAGGSAVDNFASATADKADARAFHETGFSRAAASSNAERDDIILDSQIARVLDYSGVAVWDWSPERADQTSSLPGLLGADSTAPFTPDALREFIHEDDVSRFETEVAAPIDGPFDVSLKLFDGREVRIRGARAADDDNGALERMVAFIEAAPAKPARDKVADNGVDEDAVRLATEAAIVPASADPMAAKLSAALEKGDIVAAFQPIVALADSRVAGYEALARWRDQAEGAEEGPETFVRAAEKAGKGGALARAMLDQAGAFLADKIKSDGKSGKGDAPFVAVNLSWGQMRDADFVASLAETIAKYDLPKNAVVLELTEADEVSEADDAGAIFAKLKDAGASLAFDDFGAGFSSLSNLRKYDFDYLKIDKSFAADLEDGGDGAKIVGALAELGGKLGLKVIVEGVESKSAAAAALEIGCAYGQGYALGEPTQAPDIATIKAADETAPKADKTLAKDDAGEASAKLAAVALENTSNDKGAEKDDDATLNASHEEAGKNSGEEGDAPTDRKVSRWRRLGAGGLR